MKKISKALKISELPPVSDYLSTGCTILDLSISDRLDGGFGVGRISHIWGKESTAKSILSLEPLGCSQRKGGTATLVDSEGTLDFDRAKNLFGVDTDKLNYISAEDEGIEELTIEYLFDNIIYDCIKNSKKGKPSALTVDSLSAITSGMELDNNDAYGASRAKGMSAGFRKNIWALSKSNLSLIFVDQTRQKIGVTFGKKDTFSGGEALKFYASTRIQVSNFSKIKNKYDKVIGVMIAFEIDKNKIAPPFRSGKFRLLFDYGIDDIGTNLIWLKENDPLYTAKKGFYTFDDKAYRFDTLVKYIEDNNLEEVLRKEVYRIWKIIYPKLGRKRKLRK